jgi:hypothetical protein
MVCAGFSANLESHIYKEKGKGKKCTEQLIFRIWEFI